MRKKICIISSLYASYPTRGGSAKDRSRTQTLYDIELFVYEGETLGIVGESGSGKSTLVRTALRLHEPDSGTVNIDGMDVMSLPKEDVRTKLRRAARLVYQHPDSSLNPGMRVQEILVQCIKLHRPELTEEMASVEIIEFLESVGLGENCLNRWPRGLSGGEKRRVALCRALLSEPQLLFADEPTSGLDVATQENFLDLLARVKARHELTVVIISHDLGLISRICNRVAVMKDGQIVDVLARERVQKRESEHPYVRDLLNAHLTLHDLAYDRREKTANE